MLLEEQISLKILFMKSFTKMIKIFILQLLLKTPQ